jgi:hypothetical protein
MTPLTIVERERLAIVWTRRKVCAQPRWQMTPPFFEAHNGDAQKVWDDHRARGYEPAITLRTSGLVGVEVDGPEDRELFRPVYSQLSAVPLLVELRRIKEARAHLYFRRPRELGDDEDVSLRVEGGVVTGARNNYYRTIGGDDYRLGAYTPAAPALSEEQYQTLVAFARDSERRLLTGLRQGQPLNPGSRNCTAFGLACLLFRWSDDEGSVADLVDLWNQAACTPALSYGAVVRQVRGARRIAERQLACDLDRHRTKKGGLTAKGLTDAVVHLTQALARRWAEPELAAELATAWLEGQR